MSVFVLFRVSDPEKVENALNVHFPGKFIKVSDAEFVASTTGTAKALSDKLGLTDGSLGSAIVLKMANYYGRASTDIWDWVKTEAEAIDG